MTWIWRIFLHTIFQQLPCINLYSNRTTEKKRREKNRNGSHLPFLWDTYRLDQDDGEQGEKKKENNNVSISNPTHFKSLYMPNEMHNSWRKASGQLNSACESKQMLINSFFDKEKNKKKTENYFAPCFSIHRCVPYVNNEYIHDIYMCIYLFVRILCHLSYTLFATLTNTVASSFLIQNKSDFYLCVHANETCNIFY